MTHVVVGGEIIWAVTAGWEKARWDSKDKTCCEYLHVRGVIVIQSMTHTLCVRLLVY